jgi:hypothetical protein
MNRNANKHREYATECAETGDERRIRFGHARWLGLLARRSIVGDEPPASGAKRVRHALHHDGSLAVAAWLHAMARAIESEHLVQSDATNSGMGGGRHIHYD